jgi:2-keto-4-pentenoate hydratase/2-oxohepta-3-ene-1,7-dioic acid hydratase in catechol pathway
VELGAVIGSTAKGVTREEALNHVFGYTVLIDMSARDCRRAGQWIYSKGQDSFAPMGPVLVTADEIPDPQTLDLYLTVNGVEKQRSNTAFMLFKVDELIADISAGITLEPGDIIATGTPAGVGLAGRRDRRDRGGHRNAAALDRFRKLSTTLKREEQRPVFKIAGKSRSRCGGVCFWTLRAGRIKGAANAFRRLPKPPASLGVRFPARDATAG